MTIKNGDMPAIPFEEVRSRFQGLPDKWANHCGLTKREMMAMHMMAGMLSKSDHSLNEHDVARDAVRAADALLAALEHTHGN